MYFITTKRMLEVCFFQHTPTFIIEPILYSHSRSEGNSDETGSRKQIPKKREPAAGGHEGKGIDGSHRQVYTCICHTT